MRILVITHYNIYPVDSGAAMTSFSYIDELCKRHEVEIVIAEPYVPKPESLAILKQLWVNLKIHTIAPPKRSEGIIKKIIKSLLTCYHHRRLVVESANDNIAYNAFQLLPQWYLRGLNDILIKNTYDVIEVNYSEIFSLIGILPKKSLLVAIEHECKSRRVNTFLENKRVSDEQFSKYVLRYMEIQEKGFLEQYDATICLNDHDRELVAQKISKPVYVSPVSASWEDIATIIPETAPIETVFFLGGGDHYPNYDALVWYKEAIGQVVFEKFGVKLEVIGSWSAEKRDPLKCDYIVFRGFVDDLNEVADNSLMLVPVRLGGGIRTKIQWAMSKGVPVVSTFFGYEGIPAIDGESVLEGNTPEVFIENIGKVLSDNMLRNQLRQNANQLIRQHFSPATVVASREQIYQELLRTKNS